LADNQVRGGAGGAGGNGGNGYGSGIYNDVASTNPLNLGSRASRARALQYAPVSGEHEPGTDHASRFR
jgi:hypothetical protein